MSTSDPRPERDDLVKEECPTCSRKVFPFLIVDDKCDQCRLEDEREVHKPHEYDLDDLRQERDRLLALTDWTQMPDVSPQVQAKWRNYRQALRDLPNQAGLSPKEVAWPPRPE